MNLLDIHNLSVEFRSRGRDNQILAAQVLNGVSLKVAAGETLGLVGESGAGKSVTVHAIMRLLPNTAYMRGGSIKFNGQDLASLDEAALRQIRGRDISIVVQSPLAALDPLCRIGDQLIRVQKAHANLSTAEARDKSMYMLQRVGIPDPARRMRAWPHELSGGTAQRVLIAMALLNAPKLLIADEPTTGLDATVQVQILNEFKKAVDERQLGAIVVTHDLGVVAHYCNRVAVMYSGAIVEEAPVRSLFASPRHPYSQTLLAAAQKTGGPAGTPPNLYDLPSGCLYRNRCERATDICRTLPAFRPVADRHFVACHHAV